MTPHAWTLAITGSRTLADQPDDVIAAARTGLADLTAQLGRPPALVLHGGAAGVDRILATHLLRAGIPVHAMPAEWRRHGRAAGPIRNARLVADADAVLAVWDGQSSGTADTIRRARSRGLPVAVHLLHPAEPVGEVAR